MAVVLSSEIGYPTFTSFQINEYGALRVITMNLWCSKFFYELVRFQESVTP